MAYRDLVAAGIDAASSWNELKHQVYLGSEAFVEWMQALIEPTRPLSGIPQKQCRPLAKPLAHYAGHYGDRDAAMAAAYRMQAIADHFGVGRMAVSRAVKYFESEGIAQGQIAEAGQAHRAATRGRALPARTHPP